MAMLCSAPRHAEDASSTHVYLPSLEGLACIKRPELDVAVVARALPTDVAHALDVAARDRDIRAVFEGTATAFDAHAFLDDAFDGVAADFLDEDITSLALGYAHASGKAHIKIALTTVVDDGCRKFHADYVDLRLLCTYVGPGTEVLDEAGLVREAMETDAPFLVANPKIRGAAALFRAGAGDVVVLKGRAYPGNARRGAVHRSPPIEGTSSRRLVLKIDGGSRGC